MSVLLFLHGYDDRADRWADAARAMAPEGWPVELPVGPVAMGNGTSAWFRYDDDGGPVTADLVAARDLVAGHVTAAADRHGVGPDDVVLAGFSQGGAVALSGALAPSGAAAGAVAAVVAISAWLPDVDGLPPLAERPAAGRFLIGHGHDDEAVPFPLGRSVARLLERRGVPVTFIERETGHDPAPFTAAVREWLAAAPTPRP